jgi:hypothetical protein
MWDVVVPAMKAVDPSIKVVGPATSNPASLAPESVKTAVVTTGPSDRSYLSHADFVQTLMAGAANPPDILSVHAYAGSAGSKDSDSRLFGEPDKIALASFQRAVAPYAGSTPVWLTETNVEAGHFDRSDFRGVTQFDSAWLAHNFDRWCSAAPQVSALFQFEFAIDSTFAAVAAAPPPAGCPSVPACSFEPGQPLLSYWTMMLLNRLVPARASVVSVSGVPGGLDVLAVAKPQDPSGLTVVVVNHQTSGQPGIGTPASLVLELAGKRPFAGRLWTVDENTDLVAGPPPRSIDRNTSLALDTAGYSVTFIEIHPED